MGVRQFPKVAPKDFGLAGDDAFSELVSEALSRGRLTILRIIASEPKRYTEIAAQTPGSESETSRHLRRLVDARLANKDANGLFRASPLGRALLRIAHPMQSLALRASFFSTHPTDELPAPFLHRLDEIDGATLAKDPLEVMAAAEAVFGGVSTFFYGQWVLGKASLSEGELMMQRLLRERIIATQADARGILLPEEVGALRGSLPKVESYFALRTTPTAPIALAVSDWGAILQLNDATGRIDFQQALIGRDNRFRGWCRDLFLDTWAQSTPIRP